MARSNSHSEINSFLFASNPIPMFLYDSVTLRILVGNLAAISKYGYSSAELRRMTVRDLRPYGDGPALETALLLDHEEPAHSLWTHATKSGTLFAVEVRGVPFHRGRRKLCLMSAVDATAWSEDRLKLVHSEEIHRSLVEECPFGIYRFDLTTSRFEQVNPVLLQTFGYTLDDISSLNVNSLYADPADRERFLTELLSSRAVHHFETSLRKRDGGIIRVAISGFLANDAETGHQHIQGYIMDITHQRAMEEQLNHSHRMEAVGRLAGGVAHDFNNISQSISLSCELALQNPITPALESKFLDIMQQTARAAEITRQLLAFSRRQVLQPRIVNINECIRKSLPMLTRAVGVDVLIDLQLDETVDHIVIDPEQLALVLMHLADNARVAMPKGGILRLTTATSPGCADASQTILTEPSAVLTVTDTGFGMTESIRRRIFEPFFSTKNTTLTTGLGLSTVHGIVSQSKGRIDCESTPGVGTTFRIYLPFAAELPSRSISTITAGNSRIRILLAEDEPIVNKHLTRALRQAGFSVDSTRNGEEAVAAFCRQHYNIIVTDLMMPRVDGIELTRRIRKQAPSIPVILMSGYSEEVSVLNDLPTENIAFLQKPFATTKLTDLIRTLLPDSSVRQLARS